MEKQATEDRRVVAEDLAERFERELEDLRDQVAKLKEENTWLREENEELKRRLGMSSRNSSKPPSKDDLAERAKQRANRSSRERSKDRKPGGQKGHKASGLVREEKPDRTVMLAPERCEGCGYELDKDCDCGTRWSQVWDIPPIELKKVEYLLRQRRCPGCKGITTAQPPFGQAGCVVYGPNVNAYVVLLGAEGNVPVERTAKLMEMMLKAPVSAGFVARAMERLAQRLRHAQFDEAMQEALGREQVLCVDETPVNVLRNATDAGGEQAAGSPHVVTVRTPHCKLIWYVGCESRSGQAIAAATKGVLSEFTGYLVRDDYAGWYQLDSQLAGVQQCVAHLIRHCRDKLEMEPGVQQWAGEVIDVLRGAGKAVDRAKKAGANFIEPTLLASLRAVFDAAVELGIATNQGRPWSKGNHPAYVLAKRLKDKAEQIWLFACNFAIPWTNNASEQALRQPKRHQAVSGYWHTLDTLACYLRVRSYLVSARAHGLTAIDAIHTALAGNPWLPATV